jgi:hypothetical protein
VLSFMPDAPGDALERLLPFVVAAAVAFAGSRPAVTRAALEG